MLGMLLPHALENRYGSFWMPDFSTYSERPSLSPRITHCKKTQLIDTHIVDVSAIEVMECWTERHHSNSSEAVR